MWSDLRTREIPNGLNLALIVAGVAIRAYHAAASGDWVYLAMPLAVGALFFAFAAALFYARQWGGGDAKLLIALGILLGTYPSELFAYEPFPGGAAAGIPKVAGNPACVAPCIEPLWPFWATLVLNIMFVGAVYGVLSTMYLGVHNPRSLSELKQTLRRDEGELALVVLGMALFVLATGAVLTGELDFGALASSWPLLVLGAFVWFLIKFAHIIEDIAMVREVPVSELREDDWLAEDVVVDEPVFAWEEVPGKGEDALRSHLREERGLGWAADASFSRDGGTLTASKGKRRLTFSLDGSKAVLREGERSRGEYLVREEGGRRVVYATGLEVATVRDTGVSQEQIDEILRLSREGLYKDRIRIKEGVPFAPVFPLAVILSLLVGDVTFLIILHFSP
jgi:hypothetical protein